MKSTPKVPGDSPLKLIMVTFVIVFFVALFAWQIEKYLGATFDSKLQGELTKMGMMVEADSLAGFDAYKYAYLHDPIDRAKPLDVRNEKVNFNPPKTLSTLFVENYFTPSATRDEACYWYLYFPPGVAKEVIEPYTRRDPGFVIAAWSEFKEQTVVATSPGLSDWAQSYFEKSDFECDPKSLDPNVLARSKSGQVYKLPGINFQFNQSFFSKVKL